MAVLPAVSSACLEKIVMPRAFFQAVGIQKGVSVIHPPQLADGSGAVEHGLGEGGLAGVHMGQNAQYDLFLRCFHALLL